MSDYKGRNYEIVTKNKLKPVKKSIDEIIKNLQKNMRQYSITFIPILVGSAGKSLVTQIINGNVGFDFDYNFSLQNWPNDINEKKIKSLFIKELNKVLVNTIYNNVENNTYSMTIKFINKSQSKIVHSCDFAIVNDYEEEGNIFQEILKFDKLTEKYFWNKRPYGKNYNEKVSNILTNGLWAEVRDEYLKLKNNNNESDKKSFSLYLEAVNNVYNRYNWYG